MKAKGSIRSSVLFTVRKIFYLLKVILTKAIHFSNASCTTNCLAPLAKTGNFGKA
uniref:Glyceraldehyde-3-phosphate dehydrogenase n=1 Tax=Heterorhabditis bacteriophora TaxID=37862 RepID=A0A1I7X9D7_HETBA